MKRYKDLTKEEKRKYDREAQRRYRAKNPNAWRKYYKKVADDRRKFLRADNYKLGKKFKSDGSIWEVVEVGRRDGQYYIIGKPLDKKRDI